MKRSGIYMISWPKGHYYIGSSVDLDRRQSEHSSKLRNGKHGNPHMQRVFNKYGPGRFEVLELCPPEDVLEIEQEHLDREFEEGSELFMNIATQAGGGDLGDEWRERSIQRLAKMRMDPASELARVTALRLVTSQQSWRVSQAEGVRKALAKPFRVTFPDGRVDKWATSGEAASRYGVAGQTVRKYLNGERDPAKARPSNPLRGCKFEYI